MLSRTFGFIRDIAFSHFFGASGLSDAWFIAFKIPNLSRRMFGEGAASASLIPVYSEQLHKDPEKAQELANTVVTVIFIFLSLITLLGWLGIWAYLKFSDYNQETKLVLDLTSVMLPYMIMVCTVAILAGILNVHSHFAAPAAAPVVLNIFIISAVVITGKIMNIPPAQQVFAVAVAVLLAGLAQIALQLIPLHSKQIKIRPQLQVNSQAFKKIIILMAPMIIGLTVTQINTLFDDLIAWWLSGSPEKGDYLMLLGKQLAYPIKRGSVSHLYYSQRLYQLPLGVFGISLATAIFPVMSKYAAKKDYASLTSTIAKGLSSTVFIAIPAAIGLAIVAKPLISLAFQHGKFTAEDTSITTWTLIFYSAGLCGYFAQQILTIAFYSMQDPKVPLKSAIIAVIANLFLNLMLIWPLGTAGLALSTAICSYLQVTIMTCVLAKILSPDILKNFPSVIIKTAIASVFMAIIGLFALYFSQNWPNICKIILIVPACTLAYYLASKTLKNPMLSILFSKKS